MIVQIIKEIYFGFSLIIFKSRWRKKNPHNITKAVVRFELDKVEVGKYSYGEINVLTYKDSKEKVSIGHFVSIAKGVVFIPGGIHEYDKISTFPFKVKLFSEETESFSKGPIIVSDDVWIATNCIILSGVTIGQGAIVSAGSVVTKNVPPYSIVAGNPAKVIKLRFDEKIIEIMSKIDYAKLSNEIIHNNIDLFYNQVTILNINDFVNKLSQLGIINQ